MHVLVAVDDSKPAWKALDHALETFGGAQLTALHVVDPVDLVYGDMEGGYFDQAILENAKDTGEAFLDEVADHAADAGHANGFETVLEVGQPAREIVDYANTREVDHIVVGSHGRSGVSRVLLGSVAENVARRAEVPVTIIR